MTTSPKLAGWMDPRKLAPVFKAHGRLHIPNFLELAYAEQLHRVMNEDVTWSRTLMMNGRSYDASVEALERASEEQRGQVMTLLADTAREGFQYDFETWRLSDELEAGRRAGGKLAPLEEFYDFINGPTFLSFIRQLTGGAGAAYCDAQVTRYRAGHFLNTHDDDAAGKHRLYAFVLNLTPQWRTDWGGLLLFQDGDGHVSEGYAPRFNALNIFRVPQAHSVSQVSSFVTAGRLSITGWVRGEAAKPANLR